MYMEGFRDWDVLSNYEYNPRGRIWVMWRAKVRLTPIFKCSQIITCSVKMEDSDE